MATLDGKKIAILATNGFEYSELTEPEKALEAEGAQVEVIAPQDGQIAGGVTEVLAYGTAVVAEKA